jgi:hypothetical protein
MAPLLYVAAFYALMDRSYAHPDKFTSHESTPITRLGQIPQSLISQSKIHYLQSAI